MILSKLVSLNNQLLLHLDLKALHYAYPHTEMQTPLTPLVFFATHTLGISLLQMIIDTHTEVRLFLTQDKLNTNVTLIDNSVNNLQALLEKSDAGKKVLETLTTPSVANNALAFFSHKALDTMEEVLTKANADLEQIQRKRSQNLNHY